MLPSTQTWNLKRAPLTRTAICKGPVPVVLAECLASKLIMEGLLGLVRGLYEMLRELTALTDHRSEKAGRVSGPVLAHFSESLAGYTLGSRHALRIHRTLIDIA